MGVQSLGLRFWEFRVYESLRFWEFRAWDLGLRFRVDMAGCSEGIPPDVPQVFSDPDGQNRTPHPSQTVTPETRETVKHRGILIPRAPKPKNLEAVTSQGGQASEHSEPTFFSEVPALQGERLSF